MGQPDRRASDHRRDQLSLHHARSGPAGRRQTAHARLGGGRHRRQRRLRRGRDPGRRSERRSRRQREQHCRGSRDRPLFRPAVIHPTPAAGGSPGAGDERTDWSCRHDRARPGCAVVRNSDTGGPQCRTGAGGDPRSRTAAARRHGRSHRRNVPGRRCHHLHARQPAGPGGFPSADQVGQSGPDRRALLSRSAAAIQDPARKPVAGAWRARSSNRAVGPTLRR